MNELITKIATKGYWKVIIRPNAYNKKLIKDLPNCKLLIEKSRLSLRGWDYPHIDQAGIKNSSDNSVFSFCDWPEGAMYEYWRFYQTGQFVHYFSMREDLRISEQKKKEFQDEFGNKVEKFLSILSTLYSVTEIYQFASKLYSELDVEGVEIVIELHDVNKRMLTFWDSFMRYLSRPYICEFSNGVLTVGKDNIILKEDLINNASDLALDATIEIFNKFNWDTVSKNIFIEDQKKLLERRL